MRSIATWFRPSYHVQWIPSFYFPPSDPSSRPFQSKAPKGLDRIGLEPPPSRCEGLRMRRLTSKLTQLPRWALPVDHLEIHDAHGGVHYPSIATCLHRRFPVRSLPWDPRDNDRSTPTHRLGRNAHSRVPIARAKRTGNFKRSPEGSWIGDPFYLNDHMFFDNERNAFLFPGGKIGKTFRNLQRDSQDLNYNTHETTIDAFRYTRHLSECYECTPCCARCIVAKR